MKIKLMNQIDTIKPDGTGVVNDGIETWKYYYR